MRSTTRPRLTFTSREELTRAVQLVNRAKAQGVKARLGSLREAVRILAQGMGAPSVSRRPRDRSSTPDSGQMEEWLEQRLGFPSRRLAVYGTLAPGAVHHQVLATVPGRWTTGWVRGDLRTIGPYPALRWHPAGTRIPVHVLHSAHLERHWSRLDRFEGPSYTRILVDVETSGGRMLVANLYEGGRRP